MKGKKMVYKKYIVRNGKRFGPYYYESYRDENGAVKNRYVSNPNKLENKNNNFNIALISAAAFIVLAAILFIAINYNLGFNITGHSITENTTDFSIINESSSEINVSNISNIFNETFIAQEKKEPVIKISRSAVRLGQRVKWVKNITIQSADNMTIELPKEAEDIVVKKIDETGEKNIAPEVTASADNSKEISITGFAIVESRNFNFFSWLKNIFGLTGKAVVDLGITENITEYTVEYYTDAPTSIESETNYGKQVIISGPEELNYTDIISFTNIPETLNIDQESKIRIKWAEENIFIDFNAYDEDGNGKLDYIEWITPHLSNQTFEIIILISKAEHLDANRSFIEDAYDEVKERDNIWKTIPSGNYLRVTFEKNLTSDRDITIYAKSDLGSSIKVYEKDGAEILAVFNDVREDKKYKILLNNLAGSQDTFDLKSLGDVEYDYVVDPAGSYNLSFVPPTPGNGTIVNASSVIINASLTNASDLAVFIWNWNGTNYSFFNSSLRLMMNFDNVSALGENDSYVVDASNYSHNSTLVSGPTVVAGRYGNARHFDGINDYINLGNKSSLKMQGAITVSAWIKHDGVGNAITYGQAIATDNPDQSGYKKGWTLLSTFGNATANHLRFAVGDGSTLTDYESSGSHSPSVYLINGTWYYVAGTWDSVSGEISIFIDGADASGTAFTITGPIAYENDSNLTIGRAEDVGGPIYHFNGTIDEVRIYNRRLSAAEIRQQYYSNLYKYDTDKWAFITNQSNLTANQTYSYQVFVQDNSGNPNQTEQRNVNLNFSAPPDTDAPAVNLMSPADALSTTLTSITFKYNVSDASNVSNCSLIINGAINETNLSITKNIEQNFTQTLAIGNYNWSVNCTDNSSNTGNSFARTLSITTPAPPGGGGGGGGGGPACTPNCFGKTCGDNGCGGSCGGCLAEQVCLSGSCASIICSNSSQCGIDGIFDQSCSGGNVFQTYRTYECSNPGTLNSSCSYSDTENIKEVCSLPKTCSEGLCIESCIPQCGDNRCGDNGCGGSCGSCLNGQICSSGSCISAGGLTPKERFTQIPFSVPDGLLSLKNNCNSDFACEPFSDCRGQYSVHDLITGELVQGIQSRLCADLNGCHSNFVEEKNCSFKEDIVIKEKAICGEYYTEVFDKYGNHLAKLKTGENYLDVNLDLLEEDILQPCPSESITAQAMLSPLPEIKGQIIEINNPSKFIIYSAIFFSLLLLLAILLILFRRKMEKANKATGKV